MASESVPEMVGSASTEVSDESSGGHVPAPGLTAESQETSAENDPTPNPSNVESRDVPQEVGKLLREVLIHLRQDLGPQPPSPPPPESYISDHDADSDASGETTQTEPECPMIPEVRKVDFEHFKNKFHESDGRHIIEALVDGSRLSQAVREESFKRQERGLTRFSTSRKPVSAASSVAPRDGTIRRVRIRSKSILYYLSRLAETSTQLDGTRTFLYPFVPLLYFQEEMRRLLDLLEAKWTPSTREILPVDVDAPHTNDSPSPSSSSMPIVTLDPGYDAPSTLEEFRAYVAFVDQDLKPLADIYHDTSHRSVPFEDLWLLFKPGDYIAATTGPKSLLRRQNAPDGNSHHIQIGKINPYQELWRLYGVTLPLVLPNFNRDTQNPQNFEMSEVEFDEEMEDVHCFRLHCYYIDFDGFAWRPVAKTFCIPAFEGTRSIDSLPACPLRYFENAADFKVDLIARGKRFLKCITDRHLQYTGWSLVHDPTGPPLRDYTAGPFGRPIVLNSEIRFCEPRYVDSPCIIDFEETLNSNPAWSPAFRPPDFHAGRWVAMFDDFEVLTWSNSSRTELKSREIDIVQSRDGTDMIQRKKVIESDQFLASVKRRRFGENAGKTGPVVPLRDEDLVLLPKRLFAYSLRERCLVPLDLELMTTIPIQENVFEQLKIPRTTKDLIRSVVIEHFDKKRIEEGMERGESGLMTQDSIGGKGKGLTFLLHGVPGVGKTATAEAVALEHRKPLFVLTPGEVGTSSWNLGHTLSYYFRLASRWNCILLLDEADTFLSQRSKYDVERNALVSVFLQVLEYYNGILFLTTNRVGQLDEAFQSRIHLTLYYPSLDQKQTEQIFKVNMKKLRDTDAIRRSRNGMPALQIDDEKILDFARRPFINANATASRDRSFAQWNGRQIRNAFHLASSLAYRAMAEELKRSQEQGEGVGEATACSVILDNKQFQKVADTMQAFNEYFKETRGFSDADFAFMAGDRADFWQDMTTRPPPHAQENRGRYEAPYSSWNSRERQRPHESERYASESERGLYGTLSSSAYGPRPSPQHINPYAARSGAQEEPSSPRYDVPIRGRNAAFDDIGDDPRGREQTGHRERAPPGRREQTQGYGNDFTGGRYAHERTERRRRDEDDDDDQYT